MSSSSIGIASFLFKKLTGLDNGNGEIEQACLAKTRQSSGLIFVKMKP
jgi:hypothetical protein